MQGAQYLKVGKMIHHFTIHHKKNGNSFDGFIAFLKEHYSNDSDKNDKEHKDLPFKTINTNSLHLTLHEVKILPIFVETKLIYSQKHYFSEPSFLDSKRLFSIWNPPQIV